MILMAKVLKAKRVDDIPERRLNAFWQEIDIDGNHTVDFKEFFAFYIRNFDSADDGLTLTVKRPSKECDFGASKPVEKTDGIHNFYRNLGSNRIHRARVSSGAPVKMEEFQYKVETEMRKSMIEDDSVSEHSSLFEGSGLMVDEGEDEHQLDDDD